MKRLSLAIAFTFMLGISFGQVFENEEGSQKKDTASTVLDPIRKPVDNIYEKKHIYQFKPMDLVTPREADVMYAKLIWRVLDLREKINQPFYYPKDPQGNWKSLMQAMLDAVNDTAELNSKPLMVYDDEYVSIPKSIPALLASMGETKVQVLYNEWGEDTGQSVLFIPFGASEIFRYKLFEQWFIDKQRSVMDQRIISICPMFWYESVNAGYEESSSTEEDEEGLAPISNRRWRNFGYIYYNEVRDILAVTEVFNPQNNAQRRTYDDMFLQRRFSSFIEGEENVHNNRKIYEYIVNGLDQILESEKIKENIRVKEEDLWEF